MANKKVDSALVEQLTAAIEELRGKIAAMEANPAATKERRATKAGQPRENMSYTIKNCFKAESKQPPQCLLLSRWAFEAQQAVGRDLTEPELFGAFLTHADEWNRKNTQPIWRVWQYYRPRMISAGHVAMY